MEERLDFTTEEPHKEVVVNDVIAYNFQNLGTPQHDTTDAKH